VSERETPVRTRIGAERLSADPTLAGPGRRLGLVTNYTGVMPDLGTNVAALLAAGVPLVALFGPEHGLRGTVQAGESEPDTHDPMSGLPLHDTYRSSGRALDAIVAAADVDALLVDLQDIGTRFYTYVWTMYDLLATSARLGIRFVVLDRPNPVSGLAAEGPLLARQYASFVGRAQIPVRHGLTAGELARHLNATAIKEEAGQPADLSVVAMEGWHRALHADETGLPWVMPSVNIPTLDSALAYPGTGLFEGTNLSEGRGTTRPFELIGAPYVDARWAETLNDCALPGVRFRDTWFTPTFHKYAGQPVHGVQLHVTDRTTFAPVRTGLAMLHTVRTLYPCEFGWRTTAAGAEGTGHRHFIDLLWGSASLRQCIDAGNDPTPLLGLAGSETPQHPAAWAGDEVVLYPDSVS
jgi:uncharacterized protein YbbC (DUF1343 family)